MLAVARDGVKTRNLRWKGTAIIAVHIAEHPESDMMAVMHVDR
jgi:hypothetical protein